MVFTTVFYGLTITLVCNTHRFLPRVLLTGAQHWLFTFIRGLRGVLFLRPNEDMETFFRTISNPLSVCKVMVLQTEILVGIWIMVRIDTLAQEAWLIYLPQIYRLYHFYGRNLAICIVPLVGSLGQFGS